MINAAALSQATALITELRNTRQFDSYKAWGVNNVELANQLNERVSGRSTSWPDQGNTSLCGPAAFMFCLIHDRPDLYVRYIIDLWAGRPATLGSRNVRPGPNVQATAETMTSNSHQTIPAAARINAVDWISMASLRNDSPDLNPFANYDHPSATVSAITRPKYLQDWFHAVGATTLLDNTNEIIPLSDWKELLEIAPYQASGWVAMLVSAAMFQGAGGTTSKNHWVVLNGPISINGRPISGYTRADKPDLETASVQARVFTWGNEAQGLATTKALPHLSHFLKCFHGGIAFSSIP
ncbi:hypothetical protein [Paracidovorax sp. MALMAid1276]|uniref:hypothetical protein n=1 Tax=Paracidovorax sp. MALMAid1276 TaxID=3411631 RepID=UPI003BA233C4